MKRIKYLLPVLLLGITVISCSTEDDNGNGEPLPNPVFANLFATSNTNNSILSFDFTANGVDLRSFTTSSADNEGIYYDADEDELSVNSRSQSAINTYANIDGSATGTAITPFQSSSSVLDSPRDLVVKDNFYIVSDNGDVDGDPNTDDGRIFIFTRDANGYTLRNTVFVRYAVWGIQLIGDDLYTVVDKTADVAVLKNFLTSFTADTTATPNKRITIEGITRTHGIAEDDGFVILTDIGDAANESDGGFHYINNFVSKFNATPNGGTLAFAGNQVRVSGSLTGLGNPVSVEYEHSDNTVFIAERANDGGKVLFFYNIQAGGNLAPSLSTTFPGASSLYYIDR